MKYCYLIKIYLDQTLYNWKRKHIQYTLLSLSDEEDNAYMVKKLIEGYEKWW